VVSVPLPRQHPVRVAIRVADPVLRERISLVLREAGVLRETGDLPSGRGSGADVTISDHATDGGGPVIALASSEEATAWRIDVRAVLPPDVDAALLGATITVVAAGLAVAARSTADRATTGHWAEDPAGAEEDAEDARGVALTAREREVLALLAAGASNKAIARALGVSVHTAKFHVASLTEKLGASGRLEAVAIALRTGLIMV
jgi:two-component system, NarL family, nitrate/nitrite response regulator NarL